MVYHKLINGWFIVFLLGLIAEAMSPEQGI
jgi:hypothetical protein